MLCKDTHCTEWIVDNTRPHQLHWDDWEMGLLPHAQNAVRWLALCIWPAHLCKQWFHKHLFHISWTLSKCVEWGIETEVLDLVMHRHWWVEYVVCLSLHGDYEPDMHTQILKDDFSPVDIHPLPPVWISLQLACSVHQMPALLVETVPQGRLIAEGGHIHQKCYGSVLEDDMGYYYTANALGLQYQW